MFDCYNENTHNCDGRCQGASDCPMAQDVNVNKREMKLYIENMIERKEEWNKFINKLHQDEKYLEWIEELKLQINL